MTEKEYILLYEKCASGKGTNQEIKLLEAYTDDFSLAQETWNETLLGDKETIQDEMYTRLQQEIHPKHKIKRLTPYKYTAVAAILVMLAFALFYGNFKSPENQSSSVNTRLSNHINPGGNKAILTLANGKTINLSDAGNGTLINQAGIAITKTADGQIVYKAASNGKDLHSGFNTITTPRGGQYQVILPDGSHVWLNAASSLKFPSVFARNLRNVELTGEAYFEIAKDKTKPFMVKTVKQEVRVLGTHFNINSYAAETKTTLLEGSVKITPISLNVTEKPIILSPGQQSVLSSNGILKVSKADLEESMGWKNGYFIFQDENIKTIMDVASRWYDIEVEYQGNMEGKEFWAKVSRNQNITELLKNLELTGTIHFKIEGRRVIVMP